MGHHTEDVLAGIAHTGDVAEGSVGICFGCHLSGSIAVAEQDLSVCFHGTQCFGVGVIASFSVCDRDLERLSGLGRSRQSRSLMLGTNIHVLAVEARMVVAQQCPGYQACFAEDLEPVADTEDKAALVGKGNDFLHDRRKARDGAGAQVVAVAESARKYDEIAVLQIMILVPQLHHRLLHPLAQHIDHVFVTVRSRENDDSEFHDPKVRKNPCADRGFRS